MPEFFIVPLLKGISTGKTDKDFDPRVLSVGTKVEMEHTNDKKVAERIAMDHLTEDMDYYVKLDQLEKAKPHESPSKKPPKEWWDKHYAEVKAGNPNYSDDQIRGTVGKIWYENMSTGQKKTKREKEGKKYGTPKKSDLEKTMMDEAGIQKSHGREPGYEKYGDDMEDPISTSEQFREEEEQGPMYGINRVHSPMAAQHNRDGETVDNMSQEDYFGTRDVLNYPDKGDKLKIAKSNAPYKPEYETSKEAPIVEQEDEEGAREDKDKDMKKQFLDAMTTGGTTTTIGAPMQFSHANEEADLLKGSYFDIYIDNKKGTGSGTQNAHLAPKTKYQPTKETGEKAETTGKGQALRDIEVRSYDSKNGNRGANQDAYDEATQGRLLKLQTTDKAKVIYLSVTHKADGQLSGHYGETAEAAEFNDGQGRQDTLRSIKVLGETRWTAEVIPKKKLTKGFDSSFKLFEVAPESPSLVKSIEANDMAHSKYGVIHTDTNDAEMKKSFDIVNAHIAVMHHSIHQDDIFDSLKKSAEGDVVLAKSMNNCSIDNEYVRYFTGTIAAERGARDTTSHWVDKAAAHLS